MKQVITEQMLLEEANKQGIETLTNAIGEKPKKIIKSLDNIVDKSIEFEKKIDLVNEISNENDLTDLNNPKENINPSIINEDLKNENIELPKQEKKISIWDDIKTPTNEDSTIINSISEISKEATVENTQVENIDEKEAIKAKASIVVEVIDTGFMLLCVFISWDFSTENQKFYTLNSDRKKAIKSNLEKIYAMSKKQSDPKKTIIWLILGSYAPLLILAVFSLFNRLKNKKEDQQKKTISEIENKISQYEISQAKEIPTLNNSEPEINQNPNLRPIKDKSKGKKGRHKKTCPQYKNKNGKYNNKDLKCDCK